MPAASLTSVEEYLATSYRPDRELIDGRVVERNVGERDHSRLQVLLAGYFLNYEQEWNVVVLPEQRIRVREGRYRVPDVCILSGDSPYEQVVTEPPLVCIEILSKDDSLPSMIERIDDFIFFGVPNIWVIDPWKRRVYDCSTGTFRECTDGILKARNLPIQVAVQELFRNLKR